MGIPNGGESCLTVHGSELDCLVAHHAADGIDDPEALFGVGNEGHAAAGGAESKAEDIVLIDRG